MAAQVLSFDDTIHYTSDSSSDGSDEDERALGPTDREASGQVETSKKTSWLKRLSTSGGSRKLSIQSGDIVRSPTPTSSSNSAAVSPLQGPPAQAMSSQVNGTAGSNGFVTPSETAGAAAVSPPDGALLLQPIEAVPEPKRGCYSAVFPVLHRIVKSDFFSISLCKGRFDFPLLSIFKLVLNFILVIVIMIVSAIKYPPIINVSIESFGIPSNPAQVHWDAFQAAKDDQFIIANTSLPPINTNLLRRRRESPNTLQTRSKVPFPDCPPSSITQHAIHLNWEMDLIFRVPEGAEDDNILRRDRIDYIHKVEETIYNSTEYKHFCHKRSNQLCDPLNSILTWLYPRDPKTGNYIYNTPDGFTPDLDSTISSLSANLSVALWFTGGEVSKVNNSYTAKLLRSQIRVGLPLPCFTGTRDRREEQKELVTKYFVSLIPELDANSTR